MIRDCNYTIILEEQRCGFYNLSCREIPEIQSEVTGSFDAEIISRAKAYILKRLNEIERDGISIPQGRGFGVIIYKDGAKQNTSENELWSCKDLQRYLGVSISTIKRRIADGTFKKIELGRRILFDPAQIKSALQMG